MPSGRKTKDSESTDDESGVHDIADILRNVDVRTVTSYTSDNGYESSFLMIEGKNGQPRKNSNRYDNTYEVAVAEDDSWKGTWLCRPYKRERLLEEIYSANRKGISGHAAVLNTLKNTGIMIFIVDSKVSTTTSDIMDSVRNILHHICKEERVPHGLNNNAAPRCLLFRDIEGRFFNLTFADHSSSAGSHWEERLKSFSTVQAVATLMVLCRSFGCFSQYTDDSSTFQPAFLAAFLGLVFDEEISLSWANVAMLVRGLPSLAACSTVTRTESDWPKKVVLFSLLLAAAMDGLGQHVLSLVGVTAGCAILLANLGSRTWGYLNWRPIRAFGVFDPIVGYATAMLTGLCLPFLGHQQCQLGGKASVESIVRISFVSAILFIISGYDDLQKYLVVGSEHGHQDVINLVVGCWWTFSTIASVLVIARKEEQGICPDDEEPLLVKDHASPVGYKVPNLPDFPINSRMGQTGLSFLRSDVEVIGSIILAIGLGVFMCTMAVTDFGDNLQESIRDNIFG